MLRTTRMVKLATALLTPFAAAAPAGSRSLTALQAGSSYTYEGTVHAVNPRSGSLDLITGVGMALRLVHMRTSPTTRLTTSRASLRLSDLKPGDHVRADCRRTDAGLTASRVERVEVPRP